MSKKKTLLQIITHYRQNPLDFIHMESVFISCDRRLNFSLLRIPVCCVLLKLYYMHLAYIYLYIHLFNYFYVFVVIVTRFILLEPM
jgi:hypothetical protein